MTGKEEEINFKGKYFYALGKRKNAVAKVRLYPKGKGRILVNEREVDEYFARPELVANVKKPLTLVDNGNSFDISVHTSGGGYKGQADAVKLGIARALLDMDKDLKSVLKKSNLLTRDSRKKERKKPGLKKARRAPQFSKR